MLAGLGQVKAGNARTNCARFCPRNGDDYRNGANPRPRKHGLRLGLWDDESPGSEPWWNADRRAPPAGGAAVPAARQVGLASVGVPFPFFLLRDSVIASESEAIQCGGEVLDCFVALLLAMTELRRGIARLEKKGWCLLFTVRYAHLAK